jgi:molybdopterin-guanine dinucleotide biosynthesis protein A
MIMSSVRFGISAAILAGGRAERLGGADKAALRIGASRIIDRQLAALAPMADELLIIANDSARYAALQIPVIADAIPGAGALGGVYTALQAARYEMIVVLACDLPFVTRELLERLISEARDEDDVVVPRSARGLEPLCAVYRKRCAPIIKARIDRGALQVSDLSGVLQVHEVGPEVLAAYDLDGRLFENVNTPHDYVRARAWIEGNTEPPQNRITK